MIRILSVGLGITASLVLAAAGFVSADLSFDQGRLVSIAFGREGLIKNCSASLAGRLAEKGFEPSDLDLDTHPSLDRPWQAVRTIEGHFTFLDGPKQTRVDGVMACAVSRNGVTVDFRVASTPHRDA